MQCGISTACFYPENTLEALKRITDAGVQSVEIFLNTFSELEDSFVAKLQDVIKENNVLVSSVHPFSSVLEGFFFSMPYAGRFEDGLKLYSRFFEVTNTLGANKMVFHGDSIKNKYFEPEFYSASFCALAKEGQKHGVTLCHENVYYCRLYKPAQVRELSPMFGKNAAFVLDLKQARRAGVSADEMMQSMGQNLRQVHISDYSKTQDCMPPGKGNFDFYIFLQNLKNLGYNGDVTIELYREGFEDLEDLLKAQKYVTKLIQQLK